MAAPAITLLTIGGMELSGVAGDRAKLQAAADAAALAGAHELALDIKDGLTDRAEALALLQAKRLEETSTVTAVAELVEDETAVKVSMLSVRPSFFGDLLPPGGFKTRVEAVAEGMGRTPLCILVNGVTPGDKVLNLLDSAKIQATGCLIHSNEDVVVEASAVVNAGAVRSVGPTTGSVNPGAEVGTEPVEDPFLKTPLRPTSPCADLVNTIIKVGLHVLPAGRHCKKIEVQDNAKLLLAPGEHYFEKADLKLSHNSTLTGEDVVLIFDKDSKFEFKDTSTVDLYGRKGKSNYAGFVIATTRDNTSDFIMWTDNVRRLEGVVYIPNAKLLVQGSNQIAEESAWTVIVADRMQVKGSPTMVINKNYSGSDVPVPAGVGYTETNARLER